MIKKTVREWLPPGMLRVHRALFGWRWFRGRYKNWADAQAHASGYDQPAILEKVLGATLEVRAGRAAYERDSVVFKEPAPDAHLLSNLCLVAAANGGRLRVLDFGGSLGTSYWQHRAELAGFSDVRWDVVEQPHFVEAGRKFLQDDTLRFYYTIEEAEQDAAHDVLLLSGVVHCLPCPHEYLARWVERGLPHLLFHNVPLHEREPDHVMVEHVPPEIYRATYPVWFFNKDGFMAHFAGRYDVVRQYASPAVWAVGWRDYASTGMLMKRSEGAGK